MQKNINKEDNQKKENKINKSRGITLIALVITIIVLLILAGISIIMLTGENGILIRASEAARKMDVADVREEIEIELAGKQIGKSQFTNSDIIEVVKQVTGNEVEEGTETVKSLKGNDVDISDLWRVENYIGYYADFTGPEEGKPDGVPDGIIYADLAFDKSVQWGGCETSYTKKAGLKKYNVSDEEVAGGVEGYTARVISPKEGTTGEDRFYVMALECYTPDTTYYWYNAATAGSGNLDDLVPYDTNDFGLGKAKTKEMIAKWNSEYYGRKNYGLEREHYVYTDLWGIFYDATSNASGTINSDIWFVPSKGEWCVFGEFLSTVNEDVLLNFYEAYWSSSQSDDYGGYVFGFWWKGFNGCDDFFCNYVRLSATF
ncbi:MAG: hypothetical protein HUJ68_06655 [Clostridia bacterium]|nr:hypothetical protein [Clostridia bacterium]